MLKLHWEALVGRVGFLHARLREEECFHEVTTLVDSELCAVSRQHFKQILMQATAAG